MISAVDELIALHQEGLTKNHEVLLPLIKIDRSTTYQMDLPDPNYSISLFRGDDGRYGYVKSDTKTTEHFYGMLGEDGSVESIGPVDDPVVARDQVTLALAMSPVVFYISGIETLLFGQFGAVPDWGLVVLAFVQSLFAAIGTFLLCGFCGVSSRTRTIWTVLACFVGWGICLAVVACHRRLVKDVCPSCKKPTRVDMETCTHCEKPWLPPELDQIEIFDTLVEAA